MDLKILVLPFIFLIGFVSCNGNKQNNKAQYSDLYANEFNQKLEKNPGVVLDVRTSEEFLEGHIEKAINIDFYDDATFEAKLNQLDKTKNIYVYCKSGARSAKTSETLSKLGFDNVYNLADGLDEWVENGFPLK